MCDDDTPTLVYIIEDLARVGYECRLPVERAKWTERHHQQWAELNALAKRLDAEDAEVLRGPPRQADDRPEPGGQR